MKAEEKVVVDNEGGEGRRGTVPGGAFRGPRRGQQKIEGGYL